MRNLTLEMALDEARAAFIARSPGSRAQNEEACNSMPGGSTRSAIYYAPYPITIERAEGAYLWDVDGNRYTDFVGELTAGIYGHSDPAIRAAIEEALSGGTVLGGPSRYEALLAAELCRRIPSIDLVRFCNSGTEANLMALGTARSVTGRDKVMVFDGGYHGGVLNFPVGAPVAVNAPFRFVVAPYNDTDAALAAVEREAADLAAILVEPMQGSAGCIPGEPAFLQALRDAAARHGIVLIFDEVMTSRLSPGGLQDQLGILPDMTTLGKYLGGGLSSGAFGGRAELMAHFDPRRPGHLPHAGTFNNNVCSMAAGLAGLTRVLTPEALTALNRRGDALRERLNSLADQQDVPIRVTGLGSIMNIHFAEASPRDAGEAAASHAGLRDLLHFDLLAAGQYIHRRGFMALSLPLDQADFDGLVSALESFVEKRRPLLRV